MEPDKLSSRERLIRQGILELEKTGPDGFSLRAVAAACGLSSAAPYKHFKDKDALLTAVAEAINQDWFERQREALAQRSCTSDEKLRIICREYLRFLREHPAFSAAVTRREGASGRWLLDRLFDQSLTTLAVIDEHVAAHRIPPEDAYARTFAIRTILYGAAIMAQSDSMALTDRVLQTVYGLIDNLISTPADA